MDDTSEEQYFIAMPNLNIGHILLDRKSPKRNLKHAIDCFGYKSMKIKDFKVRFWSYFRIEYRENIFWPSQEKVSL